MKKNNTNLNRQKRRERKKKTKIKKRSMRNAFIRVSAVNHLKKYNPILGKKAGEIVVYTKDEIKNILDEWNNSKQFSYFFIEHNDSEDEEYPENHKINNSDVEEAGNVHFHIVLCFTSPTDFDTIRGKFPLGRVETCRSVANCIQYLIHLNSPDKKLYSWTEVITNDLPLLEKNKIPKTRSDEAELTKLIYQIKRGEIKEYEIFSKVDILFYTRHQPAIKRAIDYYYKSLMLDKNFRKNHPVSIIVLQGKTRAGKTTFAEELATKEGMAYSMSSSTNDMFQDYMGEPVYILDDASHQEILLKNLVKFLDPHKKSTTKGRYTNKLFVGNTLIICTNVPITKWYAKADKDDIESFFSRIDYVYDFEETANHNDGNSYFRVYRIKYDLSEEEVEKAGFDKIVNPDGSVELIKKRAILEPIDNKVRVFPLKDYVDLDADEKKRQNILKMLDNFCYTLDA